MVRSSGARISPSAGMTRIRFDGLAFASQPDVAGHPMRLQAQLVARGDGPFKARAAAGGRCNPANAAYDWSARCREGGLNMACMHRVLRMALVSALLVTGFSVAPAFAEKRIALVIGNDRYQNLSAERQLQKAANDAQAVGNSLSRIGFQVIRGVNLTRQGMIDKLSELTARLEPGDTAAFFYAGHGVAIGGVNYLVPSDVPSVSPDAESRVRGASIAEGDVVAEIQGKGVRVALLVLDACRDNPFPRSGTRAVGGTRGLADAKPARGIFTLYSAGIGQSALDRLEPNDPNRNSVFTRVLIQELGNPGVDLGGLAIEVRERVAELALKAKDDAGQPDPHDQTPAYYDQTIGGRVYLAGLPKSRDEAPPSAPRSLICRSRLASGSISSPNATDWPLP